jgi:hypothetical protein
VARARAAADHNTARGRRMSVGIMFFEDLILINEQNRFFGMNKLIWRPTNAPQMKGKCHEKSASCYGGCHAPNRRCARLRWVF